MIAVGLDVGLTGAFAVAVRRSLHPGAHAHGPRRHLIGAAHVPLPPCGTPPNLAALHAFTGTALAVFGVEVARGSIASARDADPVLMNNLAAGRFVGALEGTGEGVVTVASGGDLQFNWRGALGVRGKGPAQRDASTRTLVALRLDGDLPAGPRGGLKQDYWDAAGLAIALLDRMEDRAVEGLLPADAALKVSQLNPLEQQLIVNKQTSKQANRRARAAARGA